MEPNPDVDGTWLDITEEFKSSVSQLELGELLKCEQFTLHDAMCAIEMMHPNMDGGMVLKKANRKIVNLDKALKMNLIKGNNLKFDELVGIIDHSYSCYATWLEGNSLARTVMTNLYLQDPDRIEDRCLRIFSQAMLRLVDLNDTLVQTISCIEEEDFVLNNGKFYLARSLNDQKVINSLEDLCQYYERLLSGRTTTSSSTTPGLTITNINANSNNNNSSSRNQLHQKSTNVQSDSQRTNSGSNSNTNQQPNSDGNINTINNKNNIINDNNNQNKKQARQHNDLTTSERELVKGLIHRLRFTHHLYSAFLILQKNIVTNDFYLRIEEGTQYNKVIKNIQTSISNCDNHLSECLELMEKWLKTIDLGIKPKQLTISSTSKDSFSQTPQQSQNSSSDSKQEEKEKEDNNNETVDYEYWEGDYPTIMGFEPLINQKLSPAYPRCPNIYSRPETLEYLKNLIVKMRHCLSLSNLFTQKGSFTKSLAAFEQFSKYFKPASCVLSRSLLQILYIPNRSANLIQNELSHSLMEFCEPLVESMKNDVMKMKATEEFLAECSKSFSLLICIYGHNNVRQRERLPDVIYSLKNLQYSAIVLNDALNNAFFYSWISYHLTKINMKYILSGIELELFSNYEFPYVFWFLFEILLKSEHEQLEQTRKYVLESQKYLDEIQKRNKASKANNSSSNSNIGTSSNNIKQRRKRYSTTFHDNELLNNEAISTLVKGLFFLTVGLKKDGKIITPTLKYTNEETLFERRFGILNNINQQQYQQYKQTMLDLQNVDDIYRIAFEWLSEARLLFQSMDDGQEQQESLLKVTKNNLIVAKILSTNCQDEAFKKRTVDFSYEFHPSFPTLKINYQ